MTATLLPEGKQSFTNSAGAPLVGGKVYAYDAGTNTPRATFQDAAGTVPNTNPIVLDARGEATIFWSGAYKVVLKDASDVTIWTVDGVVDGAYSVDVLKALLLSSSGSSMVGYSVLGSAHVSSVQDKLRETVSSKDFGATGVGDETTHIQALFDASAAKLAIVNTASRISAPINIPSGSRVVFAPGAKLIPTARFAGALSAVAVNDFVITDLCVEGVPGVATDYGVYIDGCSNWTLVRPRISGLGVPPTVPMNDALTGAHGILVQCTSGHCDNGMIDSPVINNIAGAGNVRGDGISVTGSYYNTTYRTTNIRINNPKITTVGRHCIALEGPATNLPNGVTITDPVLSKSALAGIDIEDAYNVTVEGTVRILNCGNDQTYYNPAAVYGATFGLMAGYTMQNAASYRCTLKGDVLIDGCYYGVGTGVSNEATLNGVVVRNSTTADWLGDGLSQSATSLKMTNCRFESLVGSTSTFRSTDLAVGGLDLKGNYFARPVTIRNHANIRINSGNTFARGLTVLFAASASPEIDDNTFLDFAGDQLTLGIASDLIPDAKIRRNVFRYSGAATHNIFSPTDGVTRAVVEGNSFEGALTANTNFSFNQTAIAGYRNNQHNLAPYGFLTSGGMVGPQITGNTFRNISTYCINFNDIFSPLVLNGANISGNNATSGCVGGLRVGLSTGSWNFVNVLGNNWNGCSGTKQSLPGVGNAGGFVAQNA